MCLRIALIGASGATGSQVLSLSLAAGHTFRVLVRNPKTFAVHADLLDVIEGDILDREAVRSFVTSDCEAVVSALGIVEPKAATTIFSDGMRNIVDAMRANHVSRLLAISASGFHTDEFDTLLTRLAKPILCRFLKHTYADLARMERVIQGTNAIDWTIFVPPRLVNRPARGHVRISHGHNIKGGMQITRADLARVMLESLKNNNTYGEMVFVANQRHKSVKKRTKRSYTSPAREEQANETRQRILGAARALFRSRGLVDTTISAVAQGARVAEPTVYAAFKSKRGLLAAVIDTATFGPAYDELVSAATSAYEPYERLRAVARIARFVHEATTAELDTIIAAGDHPEVAALEAAREKRRFDLQRSIIELLAAKKRLRKGLAAQAAHDALWAMTGRDLFRLLTRVRGWSGEHYEKWLADALCALLLERESRDGK